MPCRAAPRGTSLAPKAARSTGVSLLTRQPEGRDGRREREGSRGRRRGAEEKVQAPPHPQRGRPPRRRRRRGLVPWCTAVRRQGPPPGGVGGGRGGRRQGARLEGRQGGGRAN